MVRVVTAVIGGLVGLGMLASVGALPAAAATPEVPTPGGSDSHETVEKVTDFSVAVQLRADGSMHVRERLTWDFAGRTDRHGITRWLRVRQDQGDGRDRVYPLSGVRVESPTGASAAFTVLPGVLTRVQIGSAEQTLSGVQTYLLDYDLAGVVTTDGQGQELAWDVTGGDWEVPLGQVHVEVTGPAPMLSAVCEPSSSGCRQTVAGATATFVVDKPLDGGGQLMVRARFAGGTFPDAKPILEDQEPASTPVTSQGRRWAAAGLLAIFVVVGVGIAMRWRRGRRRPDIEVPSGETGPSNRESAGWLSWGAGGWGGSDDGGGHGHSGGHGGGHGWGGGDGGGGGGDGGGGG